jgi:hypothetical protein
MATRSPADVRYGWIAGKEEYHTNFESLDIVASLDNDACTFVSKSAVFGDYRGA